MSQSTPEAPLMQPTWYSETIQLTPEFEYLCDFSIAFEPVHMIDTAVGRRMMYVVKQGTVAGPCLNGRILPGGSDWIVVGTDRVARLLVHCRLQQCNMHMHCWNKRTQEANW